MLNGGPDSVNVKAYLYVQPEKPRNLLLQISIRGFIPIATISVAFVERCHHLSVFYDTDEFVES